MSDKVFYWKSKRRTIYLWLGLIPWVARCPYCRRGFYGFFSAHRKIKHEIKEHQIDMLQEMKEHIEKLEEYMAELDPVLSKNSLLHSLMELRKTLYARSKEEIDEAIKKEEELQNLEKLMEGGKADGVSD